AAGFLFLKVGDWRLARAERHLRRAAETSVLVHPAGAARASAAPKPPRAGRDPAQAEIDRVLDKISARGIESLTPAERRFLAEMSRKMRGRSWESHSEKSRRPSHAGERPAAGARLSPA